MANHKHVYQVVKQCIPDDINKVYFNHVLTTVDTKNTVGIYVKPTQNPIILASGRVCSRFAGVTINLFTGKSEEDLDNGYKWSEEIMDNLDSLVNKKILAGDDFIYITRARRLRDVEQLFNRDEIAVFVINYEIQYK